MIRDLPPLLALELLHQTFDVFGLGLVGHQDCVFCGDNDQVLGA
jgi:hypothetical protein